MTGPVKILHVVHSLDPGGLENGIVNLSQALNPEGFESHVFCLEQAGKFSGRFRIPANIHAHGKKPGFSPIAVLALHRRIRLLKPAIVHTHNLGPLIYGSLATALGRLAPLLHGEHSQFTTDELKPRRMFQRRWLYRGCNRIHTVSDSLRQNLVELGFPGSKLVSIPNGVDTRRFLPSPKIRAAIRENIQVPLSARVIGIVGRFGAYKRHSVLLDAFSALVGKIPDLYLVIVGAGGPNAEAVKRQVEESPVADRIRLLGFQERTEDCYQCLDLLVAPSVNEGLSNAVLEAMACGVPVLSHFACGSAEAIANGEDGFVADLSNADFLAEKLSEILANDRILADFGEKARRKILDRFSIGVMTARYEALYSEIAGTGARAPGRPVTMSDVTA